MCQEVLQRTVFFSTTILIFLESLYSFEGEVLSVEPKVVQRKRNESPDIM